MTAVPRRRSVDARVVAFTCGWRPNPIELAGRDHGLGAVARLQCSQDRGDVILDSGFGNVERAADLLVALALHHQREHGDLTLRKAELGR